MKYLKYLLLLPPAILCCIAVVISHQKNAPSAEAVPALTETDRNSWLMLKGWKAELLSSRIVTVPETLPETLSDYLTLQTRLRLPFSDYAGKHGTVYTYRLENSSLYAELLTADGILIGAECYSPEKPEILDMNGKPVT